MADKSVFYFGDGSADGQADMRNLLGGKGANLAELASSGLPVPPGLRGGTVPHERGRADGHGSSGDRVEPGGAVVR